MKFMDFKRMNKILIIAIVILLSFNLKGQVLYFDSCNFKIEIVDSILLISDTIEVLEVNVVVSYDKDKNDSIKGDICLYRFCKDVSTSILPSGLIKSGLSNIQVGLIYIIEKDSIFIPGKVTPLVSFVDPQDALDYASIIPIVDTNTKKLVYKELSSIERNNIDNEKIILNNENSRSYKKVYSMIKEYHPKIKKGVYRFQLAYLFNIDKLSDCTIRLMGDKELNKCDFIFTDLLFSNKVKLIVE